MMKVINSNKPFIIGKELYNIAQAVLEVHLSGDGRFTLACHQWLEENLRCKKALLTHSCTAALEMAAILTNIGPDDEVIMPSYTFVSTANAFVLRGGKPVFVDIRPDTFNLNEDLLEQAITSKTKAIVPVHYAGSACAMDEIQNIANQHNLMVIEDAAQALLATYKDKYLGTIGQLGCLSFHETKNVISGEGGALLINDDSLIERAEIIREKGTNRSQFFRKEIDKYTWVDIGSSYLPSELIGAFLYAQLEHTDKINTRRRELCEYYYTHLQPLENQGILTLPTKPNNYSPNGHLFYIVVKNLEERGRLIDYLKRENIYALFHYVPLHSSPAGKKYGRVASKMVVTDRIADTLLRLPLYYEMTESEIDRVVSCIYKFYNYR